MRWPWQLAREYEETRLERETPASPPTLESLVDDFWSRLRGVGISPRMIDKVWVASRCLQLNSQMIGSMPLRFYGTAPEPAWVSNPDPVWYPNGIGDAIRAAVRSLYSWGDAFLYVTARYATGYPSAWTVLDPEPMNVEIRNGRRIYRSGNTMLDPASVVQVSRNPGALRGTSAIGSLAGPMYATLSQSDLSRTLMGEGGGIPNAVLQAKKKIDPTQARAIQDAWIAGRARVGTGVPAVLGPDVDFQQLAFSPKDLMLLEAQEFNARVIAGAFGVPASIVNIPHEGGLRYDTPGLLFELWWRTELIHPATWIQDALTAKMLPSGSWVEFDARKALAPTFKELVESWKSILEMGAGTAEEFRAAVLGLPPQSQQESIEDLIRPPVAATSDRNGNGVVALRPAQEVVQ